VTIGVNSDKVNGRMTVRHSSLFSMKSLNLDKRQRDYISNMTVDRNCEQQTVDETARAIRGHWGVEADNYIWALVPLGLIVNSF
jgi:hypothetical protein